MRTETKKNMKWGALAVTLLLLAMAVYGGSIVWQSVMKPEDVVLPSSSENAKYERGEWSLDEEGKDLLGDAFRFITENTVCKVLSYKGNVFGLECPNFMDLEVTETEPGLAGNTATNTLKPATVETGAEVKVPLFINIGDKISIDTRTGEYIGRAK